MKTLFDPINIDKTTLLERAYNLRWAEVADGVIPLTAADPDFPCAPQIAEAINQYTSKRYFSYGPPDGLPVFKDSMSAFLAEKRSIQISAANILPVDSAAFGIYLTCKALLQPGDEAIIFDPVDFLFRYSIETVGGKAVPFAISPGNEAVDFSLMELLITKKTKLICLCNPLNPTGKVFSKTELLQLGAVADKHGLIILSDEIWSDIVFRPSIYTSIASLGEAIKNRTVIVTGFSKSYGLAGLRIGAVMANDQYIFQKLRSASLHQSTVHGCNTISQVAAATAMNECGEWLNQFLAHLQNMRDISIQSFNRLSGFSCHIPDGCYVALADIRATGKTSKEMHAFLLSDAKVAVVPGLQQWFGAGAEGYIRISFATTEAVLNEAFYRIQKSIQSL